MVFGSWLALLDTPHYLVADDKVGEEAFAVIREAMVKLKIVSSRSRALQPRARGAA